MLDLGRAYVLPLADDDVLQPAGDDEKTVRVQPAEVTGPEVALVVERGLIQGLIHVPRKELRPSDPDLAISVGAISVGAISFGGGGAERDDTHVHPSGGSSLGRGELLVRVAHAVLGCDRALGHAIAGQEPGAADLPPDLPMQFRGLGGAAARVIPCCSTSSTRSAGS